MTTISETGAVRESRVMKSGDWIKFWEEGAIGFHKTTIHPLLEKNLHSIINGRSNIQIFFPLCGKALDMKWLAEQGHTVIGVDVAKQALQEFFTEQNLEYTVEQIPGIEGSLFQSIDKRVRLYCCDFYLFSKEIAGLMDAVWDRGALVAINNNDRERYASIIKSLMAPGCRYLLAALQYDENMYGGPPHHLSDEAVKELFAADYQVELLDDDDAFEPEKHAKWGLTWIREKVFLIGPQ